MNETNLAVADAVQCATKALRENRNEEAIQQLQQALVESPENFAVNHLAGVAFLKAGRFPEAIARLLKATQLDGQHVAARTHLGMAYAAAGKTELARKAFQQALEIDTNYALAISNLDKLPPAPTKQKAVPQPKTDEPQSAVAAKMPLLPTPPAAKSRDFTQPGAVKPKPAKKESIFKNVDWADMTLLGLGAVIMLMGLWLRFGAYVEGMRPYKGFGILALIIGGSMVKAGMPGREHWRDDF